jgi:hypothetical protein
MAACMGEMRNAYNIFVGKPDRKRSLGGPWCRYKYNIRMDIREIGCESVELVYLAQDRDQ